MGIRWGRRSQGPRAPPLLPTLYGVRRLTRPAEALLEKADPLLESPDPDDTQQQSSIPRYFAGTESPRSFIHSLTKGTLAVHWWPLIAAPPQAPVRTRDLRALGGSPHRLLTAVVLMT